MDSLIFELEIIFHFQLFLSANVRHMAPSRAESDFGLQGWIDTLGLKQIFLIYSVKLFLLFRRSVV